MDQEIERKVRERAYAIWEQEGRPDGQHLKHWEQAARLVAAELVAAAPASAPTSDPPARSRR